MFSGQTARTDLALPLPLPCPQPLSVLATAVPTAPPPAAAMGMVASYHVSAVSVQVWRGAMLLLQQASGRHIQHEQLLPWRGRTGPPGGGRGQAHATCHHYSVAQSIHQARDLAVNPCRGLSLSHADGQSSRAWPAHQPRAWPAQGMASPPGVAHTISVCKGPCYCSMHVPAPGWRAEAMRSQCARSQADMSHKEL